MNKKDKAIGLFEKYTVWAMVILGFLITVFLTSMSMMYTEWSTEAEEILQQPDSLLGNWIFLAILLVLFTLIRRILPQKEEVLLKTVRIIAFCGTIYAMIFSLVWVLFSCVQPYADGWYVCLMADLINNGIYDIMARGVFRQLSAAIWTCVHFADYKSFFWWNQLGPFSDYKCPPYAVNGFCGIPDRMVYFSKERNMCLLLDTDNWISANMDVCALCLWRNHFDYFQYGITMADSAFL